MLSRGNRAPRSGPVLSSTAQQEGGAATGRSQIDVAIVNWNTSRAAATAARAYLASTDVGATVSIVDNSSQPEQREQLRADCPPGVRLELSEENLGYGKAANRALRGGGGELICVSNADVVPKPGALSALGACALAEPRAGMVGPVFGGETDSYHAALPSAATMLARIFVGSFGERSQPSPDAGATAEVGQPSGACFVVRRELWEQVGGFDQGFFLWYEDVDLAKRLHDAGYRNLVVGSALAGHAGAEAFAQIDPRRQQAIRLDSVERYIRKHHPAVHPIARPMLWLARRLRAGSSSAGGHRA